MFVYAGSGARWLSLSLMLFFSLPLLAQSITAAKITGTVTDANGDALPGVTLNLTSPDLISGSRTAVSSDRGRFAFLGLPPGDYKLAAVMTGFKTWTAAEIVLRAGSSRQLDPVLEAGGVEESVMVTADVPIIDRHNSTIDTTLDGEMLEKLPTSRDAFYDLALTAPGVSDVGSEGSWLKSPTAYGGASNENVFLLNGVNTTNPRGASWGSLVNVNYNTVKEVRVISLGSKAEYGSFSGVAIDVLTETGSNEFHGNISYFSLLDAADNQGSKNGSLNDFLYVPDGAELMTRPEEQKEYNVTFGGPIIKDRVWFYAGVARIENDDDTPNFELFKEYRASMFDLKISAEPTPNQRAWVAYHREKTDKGNESWGPWDNTMVYHQHSINDTISAQWEYFASGKTFFSAKYLGFSTDDEPTVEDVGHPGFINWWKWDSYGVGGAFPYVEAQKSERNTLQADVTHYAEDFLGEHEMKFGVQVTKAEGNWMGGYFHGYANFAYPVGWSRNVADYPAEGGLPLYVTQRHLNPFLTARESDNEALFFDDQWVVNDRVTLNIGLRYEKSTAGYGTGKVFEMPNNPEDINSPTLLRERDGAGTVFDFTDISPRLGVSWALTPDGKTMLKANFGRYYAPLGVESLRRFGPDMPEVNIQYFTYGVPFDIADGDGDGFITNAELREAVRHIPNLEPTGQQDWGNQDTSWSLNVADDLENTHTDQFTLSLEREFLPSYVVRGTYIYKDTKDLIGLIPLNGATGQPWEYERIPHTTSQGEQVDLYSIKLQDYNADGVADFEDVRWVLNNVDYQAANMPSVDGVSPGRTYKAIQLEFFKHRTSRWEGMASFLWTDANGLAPRTTSQDWYIDGAMVMDTPFVGSMNQLVNNMNGPLPYTPDFEFKFSGNYTIPKIETDMGFRFRHNSGRPVWPLEVVPSYAIWDGGFRDGAIISTGGGVNNNVVAIDPDNPRTLPKVSIFDLSLSRTFKLGDKGNLGASLDVLNVFNDDTVNKVGFYDYNLGEAGSLVRPRVTRLNLRYSF